MKNLPASAGDAEDLGSFPESGRSPGEGNGTHSSGLAWRVLVDRGGWQAAVHGVTELDTTEGLGTVSICPFQSPSSAQPLLILEF